MIVTSTFFLVFLGFVIADSPTIQFVYPTPANQGVQTADSVYVNVTLTNANSSFIDWNNSLVGWWRFDNSSDFTSHSNHTLVSYFGGRDYGGWLNESHRSHCHIQRLVPGGH